MELHSSPQRVPVTYVPISMQKQLAANHRAIGGKPYECFFLPEIEVPAAGAKLLRAGPLPREQTLTPSIADLDRLLSHASDSPDHGYALLDGPTAYAQSRVVMPGVTTRMFEWWFHVAPAREGALHAVVSTGPCRQLGHRPSKAREHVAEFCRASLKQSECIRRIHRPGLAQDRHHFAPPASLGLDQDKLRQAGLTTSASGTIRVANAPNTTFMFMLHLARGTQAGMELLSRYGIGAHPEFVRFPGGRDAPALLSRMGMDADATERLAYEMAMHDMTEFAHLGRVLPDIFAALGDT